MKRITLAVALLGILGAACGTAAAQPEPQATETVTVTAAPTVTEVVEPIEPIEPETLGSNGDARACEELRLAATREPNSNSWIDIVSEANWDATDYDLMDAIDEAYWTSGNALAGARIDGALEICDDLGV